MTFHIHCLSLLILLACCAPTFFGISIDYIANIKDHVCKDSNNHLLVKIIVSETILLILVYMLLPAIFVNCFVNWWWIPIAIGMAPVNILLEIGEGYILQIAKGNRPSQISFNSKTTDGGISGIVYFAVIAVTEELIFRLVWINILTMIFGFSIIAGVLFSVIIYALNHMYYGINTVIQKLISGTVYSLLLVMSGGMILAPILCHMTQNIVIVGIGELRDGSLYGK